MSMAVKPIPLVCSQAQGLKATGKNQACSAVELEKVFSGKSSDFNDIAFKSRDLQKVLLSIIHDLWSVLMECNANFLQVGRVAMEPELR